MYSQLSPLLEKYRIMLEDYLPARGVKLNVPSLKQRLFLDLANIHRKLIKSLCILISEKDTEYDVAIYAICRALTANALTTYYFRSFVNSQGEIDENICND